MKELEALKSDDIEIVGLFTKLLLKKRKIDEIKKYLKEENKYYISERFEAYYLVKKYTPFVSNKGYTISSSVFTMSGSSQTYSYNYNVEEEELFLMNKPKKDKTPMYKSFLIPKNKRKNV